MKFPQNFYVCSVLRGVVVIGVGFALNFSKGKLLTQNI